VLCGNVFYSSFSLGFNYITLSLAISHNDEIFLEFEKRERENNNQIINQSLIIYGWSNEQQMSGMRVSSISVCVPQGSKQYCASHLMVSQFSFLKEEISITNREMIKSLL